MCHNGRGLRAPRQNTELGAFRHHLNVSVAACQAAKRGPALLRRPRGAQGLRCKPDSVSENPNFSVFGVRQIRWLCVREAIADPRSAPAERRRSRLRERKHKPPAHRSRLRIPPLASPSIVIPAQAGIHVSEPRKAWGIGCLQQVSVEPASFFEWKGGSPPARWRERRERRG